MGETDDLFRDLCENANDLIQSVSPQGTFLYVNRAWLAALGYGREEVGGLHVFDVIHPDSRAHCERVMGELLGGRAASWIEADFLTRDGRRLPVEGSARCRFEDGRPVATRGIFRDVSLRRELQAELQRHFALSLDLMCVAGTDGYFKQVNPAFERVLGYSREELLGRPFVDLVHPDDRERTSREVERIGGGGAPVIDFQNRYRAKDGSWRWLSWRSTTLPERGVVYAVARDVTERKRLEETLERQAAELARSNADLEQFAYAVSHDLHAPLRAVASLAGWIEEELPESLAGSVREYLQEMRRRVRRMGALIDDLLKYARAGRGSREVTRVDTGAMIEDLVSLLAPPEGFRIVAGPGLPRIETVRPALEQIFLNLIDNAVKHHDRSGGTVRIAAVDAGAMWEFSVADDGPGIPEEHRGKVFEMFERLKPIGASAGAGSGMGLALVRRLVEVHGGRIRVEEAPGGGAVFTFTWPKRIEPSGPS